MLFYAEEGADTERSRKATMKLFIDGLLHDRPVNATASRSIKLMEWQIENHSLSLVLELHQVPLERRTNQNVN